MVGWLVVRLDCGWLAVIWLVVVGWLVIRLAVVNYDRLRSVAGCFFVLVFGP